MPKNPNILNDLHCVRFRNVGFKRTMVLSPSAEKSFNRFLVDSLGQDVFLISTALGLDVYYCYPASKTDFIVKNLWLFQENTELVNKQIVHEHHKDEVLLYFTTVVNTLLKHPQLFLSTCKKFVFQYKRTLIKNQLITLLFSSFELHLQELITQNRLPYISKIERIMQEIYIPSFQNINSLGVLYHSDESLN